MVWLSWADETGEHDAQLYMERSRGRVMLQRLQQETGLEPRDLEKERKDFEDARRELRRWAEEQSKQRKETVMSMANTRLQSAPAKATVSAGENTGQLQKLVAAKSVLLLIASAASDGAGGELFGTLIDERVPAREELTKAIQKWNRFVIVNDVSKADLVLVVVEWEDFHRRGRTVACRDWLLVFDGGALPTGKSQPLWQGDREQWGKWGGCSGAGQPVKELRKAIEKARASS